MIIIYGMRLYGTIDRCGETRIATRFVHVYGLPIVPLGSVLVLENGIDGNSYTGLPIGLNFRSVAAAYARIWGIGAAVLALVAVSQLRWTSSYDLAPLMMSILTLLACAGALVWGWGIAGRLGAVERAQRMVYSEHAGYPVDVAMLRDRRERMRDALQKKVAEQAAMLGATGYRMGAGPASAWDEVALDPSVSDRDFLGAALTLARLDWSLATSADKAKHAERHAAIWKKIETLDPSLLSTAAPL